LFRPLGILATFWARRLFCGGVLGVRDRQPPGQRRRRWCGDSSRARCDSSRREERDIDAHALHRRRFNRMRKGANRGRGNGLPQTSQLRTGMAGRSPSRPEIGAIERRRQGNRL
jgi:hypothetical protein